MASNKQWIERVLFKLNELFLEGSDFEDRRWIFDWGDKLSKKQNLENVADEDRAIETLTQAGVIVTRSIDNHYRGQQLRANEELEMAKFFNPNVPSHATNTLSSDWNSTDQAHREYDWLRLLDGFNYEKFQRFCELHGFNPSTNGTIAKLEIISDVTPVVEVAGKRYTLPTLSTAGVPQKIIAYASKHFDTLLEIDDLRENVHATQLTAKGANIKQSFRKNIFSGELASFADISSKSFMLKSQALITPSELEAIRKLSTH